MVVAAAASPPAPIRNCLRLMAIVASLRHFCEVDVKAFSHTLRSEHYGGFLDGVNAPADDETKLRNLFFVTPWTSLTPLWTSHVAWDVLLVHGVHAMYSVKSLSTPSLPTVVLVLS